MRTEMSRRTFGAVIAGGAMTARVAAAVETGQAGEVAALYKRAVVIDALANPGSMNVSWPPRGPLSEKQRDAIAASGITAINVTVSGDTFEASTRTIALWTGEADRYPTLLSIVRRHADIARAKADGTLGLILGFQNTEMLERDLSRLDVFHRLGVRIIQLTYNDRNLVGDGCLEPGDAGLSAYGRQVVERMNTPRHRGRFEPLRHADDGRRHRGVHQTAAHYPQRLPRGLPPPAEQGRSRAAGHGR